MKTFLKAIVLSGVITGAICILGMLIPLDKLPYSWMGFQLRSVILSMLIWPVGFLTFGFFLSKYLPSYSPILIAACSLIACLLLYENSEYDELLLISGGNSLFFFLGMKLGKYKKLISKYYTNEF